MDPRGNNSNKMITVLFILSLLLLLLKAPLSEKKAYFFAHIMEQSLADTKYLYIYIYTSKNISIMCV